MKARRHQHAAGLACLLLALCGRQWLEATMFRHMMLQLPLIVLTGWLLARPLPISGRWAAIDRYGLTSLTALLFISAYWMVPRALEQSLDQSGAEAAKFASLLLAGALLPAALRRSRPVIQLFYLGNFCWMCAFAGMQYQDMPQRLCNAYALDDQLLTGVGLVGWSILIAIAWCLRNLPALLSNSTTNQHHALPGFKP